MDETDDERRKRLSREATSRYRAAHPDKVRARQKAHRDANIEEVRRLDRETKLRWRQNNPDESRARANAYGAKNREAVRVRAAAWRLANPEEVKKLSLASRERRKEHWDEFLLWERARYHANPGPKLEWQKAQKQANPAKFAASFRRHYLANKPKYLAHCAARRARRVQATPVWCDRAGIVRLYIEAQRLTLETGIPHEVDHIIPLRGKMVCGLHIPLNMQIITRTENRRKFNRLIDGDTADRSRISATPAV